MEIAPGIHSLPAPAGTFMGVFPPNVYLVVGQKAALIDAGHGDEKAVASRLATIKELGVSLAYIVLTHPHLDHTGGAPKIREATGARVLVHPSDAEEADRGLKQKVVDGVLGDKLDLGGKTLTLIHTPGHSPGSVCPYLADDRMVFAGDTVLGVGTTAINPPRGDMAAYMDSLRRLLEYPADVLCPGHGPLVKQPHRKLVELLTHRQEREAQVLSLLSRGKPSKVEELLGEIYPELDKRLADMAKGQVRAHLAKLACEGRAVAVAEDVYRLP